jgi:hypothetical protein
MSALIGLFQVSLNSEKIPMILKKKIINVLLKLVYISKTNHD